MRVAIAGIWIESSGWAAHRADFRDFRQLTGEELMRRYPFLAPGQELRAAADWVPVLHAASIPGGAVRAEVYADFKRRIVSGLAAAMPLDGVYLDIHGAMLVDGLEDAEGDLVTAVRGVVGPDVLIAAPMDLHGNVSPVLAAELDLPTCFRLAPHEDNWITRERSARTLVAALRSGTRPLRAWVPVPILLPGEKTSTRVEPARSLYARVPEVEALDGVIDAGIWIGYAWADEPRCHANVCVTGTDEEVVRREAEGLARAFWEVRDAFAFVGPPGTLEEAVDAALAHVAAGSPTPYLVSDSGDNPGAGGSGDVTWTLERLLADRRLTGPDSPTTFVASIFDAGAVEELWSLGVGEAVDVEAGARVDHRASGPVRIRGVLHSRTADHPDGGRMVVIRVGGLHVVLGEFRTAFHEVDDFLAVGLDPHEADVVVTKIGYLEPSLHDLQQGWTLALTPGGVDQDLERLGHHRIGRPMVPFDAFDTDPDLTARVL